MNEELKNNENYEVEGSVDNYEPETVSNCNSGNKTGILALGLAVVGGVAYLWKNKDKIKQKHTDKQIAKWEKKGYTVTKNPELEETVEVGEVVPEETEEE